jgi:DNA recombination protein RmuC
VGSVVGTPGVLLVVLVAGVVGVALAVVLAAQHRRQMHALVRSLGTQLDEATLRADRVAAERHQQDLNHALDTLVTVAGERLEARARAGASDLARREDAVDTELRRVGTTLAEVAGLVQRLERERADQLGRVSEQLHGVTRVHADLAATTAALRETLTSSQARGQWGERMAEDVLTAAGFRKGVNYLTQQTLPSGERPDVTFLLPGDLCLHMDVKFPLARYLAMLEATGDADREAARRAFLRDARARVRELTTRGYVDPDGGTLDVVLLFVPNEQVYAFVQEHDPGFLDEALRAGVVTCGPSTLFAVLAVIRRSIDTVALQRTSDEIVALLAGFSEQWGRYVEEVERLGKQLETVRRTYDSVAGPRRRQLERQLDRVEELRDERQVGPQLVDGRPRLVASGGADP